MSWIPEFEIGLWNAWLFMIWWIVLPFFLSFIVKEKKVVERLNAHIQMKFEKLSNLLWLAAVYGGFLVSIFIPLQLNTLWFYIGFIIFIFGAIINLMVRYTWRKAKPDSPFTTGTYRYSRHPIYVSFLLIYSSIAIMSLSWIFLIITTLYALHLFPVIPAEERYCLQTYGKEYKDYMERTPRWIGLPKSRVK